MKYLHVLVQGDNYKKMQAQKGSVQNLKCTEPKVEDVKQVKRGTGSHTPICSTVSWRILKTDSNGAKGEICEID